MNVVKFKIFMTLKKGDTFQNCSNFVVLFLFNELVSLLQTKFVMADCSVVKENDRNENGPCLNTKLSFQTMHFCILLLYMLSKITKKTINIYDSSFSFFS